ncbi:MAG: hypothetical protein HY842_11480, partial [Bacteroidetes bacterium]|nr:hypothetical protein [Bacteroidota bacterium]
REITTLLEFRNSNRVVISRAEIIAESQQDNAELTPAQQTELELAIQETYDPENLVDHEQVMEEMKRFIKK